MPNGLTEQIKVRVEPDIVGGICYCSNPPHCLEDCKPPRGVEEVNNCPLCDKKQFIEYHQR